MVPMNSTLVWFRQDLRLHDNPALRAAIERGAPVIPVFIWDEAGEGEWPPGAAARWALHHALAALDVSLRERGSRLVIRRGKSAEVLRELVRRTKAQALFWNRRYEPAAVARDGTIAREFVSDGMDVRSFNAALLNEPHAVLNRQGGPFQVFTPYWRTCLAMPVAPPTILMAKTISAPLQWPASLALAEIGLLPRAARDAGLRENWKPGEAAAQRRLGSFIASGLDSYDRERNRPAHDGTSRLSPSLRTGEIGPRQIWAAVKARAADSGVFPSSNGARAFLAELGWREFAHHLLYHFPHTPERPRRAVFENFPWARDPGDRLLLAWQRGETGYPMVDAGMRQLWRTGWMHNRVRMIAASFLVKHLRLPWTLGAAWFWDTLVDADLANNTLGWQWVAGCGADASPYFRIFAPVLQGTKFDPDGSYVRRWVPELSKLPTKHVHAPWTASSLVLAEAGVELGRTYPAPIVDHIAARNAALAAYQQLRKQS